MTDPSPLQPGSSLIEDNTSCFYFPSGRLGMLAFLISDAVTFATLLVSSSFLRAWSKDWPASAKTLNLSMAGIMTGFLFASSIAMVSALAAVKQGNQPRFKRCLLFTIIGGVVFLLLQAREWSHLFHQGLTLAHNPWGTKLFGASFYVLTGFHGCHVIAGLVALAVLLLRGLGGRYHPHNTSSVALAGLYWYFVDVTWLFIFVVVYLL